MPSLLFALRRPVVVVAALIVVSCGGSSSGGTGTPPVVTPASVTITPPAAPILFGALGRTRQLTATVLGSDGLPIASPTLTWQSSNQAAATVSATGLVTAVANGTTNITATTGSLVSTAVPITVTQVMTTIAVASPNGNVDSLRTATRTRQYTATAKDSTGNTVGGVVFAWSSSNTAVATVNPTTGLVTSGTTNGTANIIATSGAVSGQFAIGTALYAATITVSPSTPTITTPGGTQLFTGTAADSIGTPLTTGLFWTSRTPAVATVNPTNGSLTSTATAVSNGTTRILFSAGARSDSALLTVTGQLSSAPSAISVTVGDNFFKSVRNNSVNAAIDTVAVGGTVTWTWSGFSSHSVESLLTPTFASSVTRTAPFSYQITFNTPGTYQYDCVVHGAPMTGTIIVR
jgi:plastocyanin